MQNLAIFGNLEAVNLFPTQNVKKKLYAKYLTCLPVFPLLSRHIPPKYYSVMKP